MSEGRRTAGTCRVASAQPVMPRGRCGCIGCTQTGCPSPSSPGEHPCKPGASGSSNAGIEWPVATETTIRDAAAREFGTWLGTGDRNWNPPHEAGLSDDGGIWRGPTQAEWTKRLLRGAPPPRKSTGSTLGSSSPTASRIGHRQGTHGPAWLGRPTGPTQSRTRSVRVRNSDFRRKLCWQQPQPPGAPPAGRNIARPQPRRDACPQPSSGRLATGSSSSPPRGRR